MTLTPCPALPRGGRGGTAGLAALIVAGCGGDAGPAVTVLDSAGVTIAENAGEPSWPAGPWVLDSTPSLDLGGVDVPEEQQFGQVGGIVRLSDGTVVVADGASRALRYFDASGTFLRSAGRQGGGPGEFEGIGPLSRLSGDTIAVWDWRLNRLSLFAPSGAFVRSVALQYGGGAPQFGGYLGDGTWLFTTNFSFAPSDVSEVVRDTTPYLRFAADGTLLDTLLVSPSWEYFVQGSSSGGTRAASLFFGRGHALATYSGGFYAGVTDRYDIGRYRPDGTLELIIRRTAPRQPVTASLLEAAKAERLENVRDAGARPQFERFYAEMPRRNTVPAFSGMVVDASGFLWIAEYPLPTRPTRDWVVFDPDGRMLGAVRMPKRFEVRAIGRDHVLGTWEDGLDVTHVQVYALIRGER